MIFSRAFILLFDEKFFTFLQHNFKLQILQELQILKYTSSQYENGIETRCCKLEILNTF